MAACLETTNCMPLTLVHEYHTFIFFGINCNITCYYYCEQSMNSRHAELNGSQPQTKLDSFPENYAASNDGTSLQKHKVYCEEGSDTKVSNVLFIVVWGSKYTFWLCCIRVNMKGLIGNCTLCIYCCIFNKYISNAFTCKLHSSSWFFFFYCCLVFSFWFLYFPYPW